MRKKNIVLKVWAAGAPDAHTHFCSNWHHGLGECLLGVWIQTGRCFCVRLLWRPHVIHNIYNYNISQQHLSVWGVDDTGQHIEGYGVWLSLLTVLTDGGNFSNSERGQVSTALSWVFLAELFTLISRLNVFPVQKTCLISEIQHGWHALKHTLLLTRGL